MLLNNLLNVLDLPRKLIFPSLCHNVRQYEPFPRRYQQCGAKDRQEKLCCMRIDEGVAGIIRPHSNSPDGFFEALLPSKADQETHGADDGADRPVTPWTGAFGISKSIKGKYQGETYQ